MEYFVFDTETTGLTSKDEVFQFAGLLLDESLAIVDTVNFYCYTQVPLNPEAAKVNKMSATKIMQLSHGRYFEDFYYELDLFKKKDITWIGYNVSFDIRMVNNSLGNNGLPKHDFGRSVGKMTEDRGIYNFDMMQYIASLNNGHRKKLTAARQDLNYSDEKLDAMYQGLLQLSNFNTEVKEHNALYDAMITWLLLYKYRGACGKWSMQQ